MKQRAKKLSVIAITTMAMACTAIAETARNFKKLA